MTGEDTPVAAGPVVAGLEDVVKAIEALAQSNRGENPAPFIFDIAQPNRTHVRLRVVAWVIAAANVVGTPTTLTIGAAVIRTVVMSLALTTLVVPLPITIERGVDVVAAGGELVDSWLIVYPE
jgi:hypothetical protein